MIYATLRRNFAKFLVKFDMMFELSCVRIEFSTECALFASQICIAFLFTNVLGREDCEVTCSQFLTLNVAKLQMDRIESSIGRYFVKSLQGNHAGNQYCIICVNHSFIVICKCITHRMAIKTKNEFRTSVNAIEIEKIEFQNK